MSKRVEWTIKAKASLDQYCAIIEENSSANAKKVRREIVLPTSASM